MASKGGMEMIEFTRRLAVTFVLILAAVGVVWTAAAEELTTQRISAQTQSAPKWKKAYTEYLGKLIDTKMSPLPVGYVGADMGVSFPVGDRIFFTAGDMAPRPWGPTFYDGLASASLDWDHKGLPALHFVTTHPPFLAPPHVAYGCNEGPFEGFSHGGNTYLFYSTDWYGGQCPNGLGHRTLALVHANGTDLSHLVTDWKMPVTHFQLVSVVADGGYLWVFGSGEYRKSSVYLARVPLPSTPGPRFLDPGAWRFYDGHGGFTITDERKAVPIIEDKCVGELSVRRHPQLGIWLMMSGNCGIVGAAANIHDRGFVLRTAQAPTGPWSDPYADRAGVIWDLLSPGPHDDPGYTSFMHARNADPRFLSDDGLAGYGQEPVWGGEYGPQMIPEFFTQDSPGVFSLYYTVSSWNPYLYHLMHTVMVQEGVPIATPPQKGQGLAPAIMQNADFSSGTAGWIVAGQAPHIVNSRATIGPRSSISQEFTVDAGTKALKFEVSGDAAGRDLSYLWNISAELVDAKTGDILRRTWPINVPLDPKGKLLTPMAGTQHVRWNLIPLRGQRVRLVIANHEDKGTITVWGFDWIRSNTTSAGSGVSR